MTEFEDQYCISCFISFRVPKGFTDFRRRDCSVFYCPNGHQMNYSRNETPEAVLKRERDRLAQQIAQRDDALAEEKRRREYAERQRTDAETARAIAQKRLVKLKARAATGTCPCCNRNFSELQKHIATKHPTFRAEDVTRENIVSLVKAKTA